MKISRRDEMDCAVSMAIINEIRIELRFRNASRDNTRPLDRTVPSRAEAGGRVGAAWAEAKLVVGARRSSRDNYRGRLSAVDAAQHLHQYAPSQGRRRRQIRRHSGAVGSTTRD